MNTYEQKVAAIELGVTESLKHMLRFAGKLADCGLPESMGITGNIEVGGHVVAVIKVDEIVALLHETEGRDALPHERHA